MHYSSFCSPRTSSNYRSLGNHNNVGNQVVYRASRINLSTKAFRLLSQLLNTSRRRNLFSSAWSVALPWILTACAWWRPSLPPTYRTRSTRTYLHSSLALRVLSQPQQSPWSCLHRYCAPHLGGALVVILPWPPAYPHSFGGPGPLKRLRVPSVSAGLFGGSHVSEKIYVWGSGRSSEAPPSSFRHSILLLPFGRHGPWGCPLTVKGTSSPGGVLTRSPSVDW